MKKVLIPLILSIFLFPAYAENRIALVIGNSRYQNSPLQNPEADATAVAKVLQKASFQVDLVLNADQKSMDQAIARFGRRLTPKSVGLVYYAGHAVQSKGQNYLIPLRADLEREAQLKYKTVNVGSILEEIGQANNQLNIVILDACRNNPLMRSFRSAGRGLRRMDGVPVGTLVAYATSPGSTASDGGQRHSPYTLALLRSMQKPGLTLEQVFKNTAKQVKRMTRNQQVPWFSSSFSEDFYFFPRTAKVPQVKREPKKSEQSTQALLAKFFPAERKQSWKTLGFSAADLDQATRQQLGIQKDRGVLVYEVFGDHARHAGLRKGDILLMMNNKDIRNSRQLHRMIASLPEKPIPILIQREQSPIFLAYKLIRQKR